MVNELMIRLESVPVTKGGGSFQKFKKHGKNQNMNASLRDYNAEENPELNLSKADTQLNFILEVKHHTFPKTGILRGDRLFLVHLNT